MTDWREAGRKSWATRHLNDAHRIRDLYRATFQSPAKGVARNRVIAAMKAAGVTTVLDLWGGGVSGKAFTDAGFQVISIDNGSMDLTDQGRLVTKARKRRALERTAEEDGYQARWGSVPEFAQEADGAFLDFCGPWSKNTRAAVEACRHMKAVAVTLMSDHDIATGATNGVERHLAYSAFLRHYYGGGPKSARIVRLFARYTTPYGHPVWLYLLHPGKRWMKVGETTDTQARRLNPHRAEYSKEWQRRDREQRNADPAKREQFLAVRRHREYHVPHPIRRTKGVRKPCPICVAGGGPT